MGIRNFSSVEDENSRIKWERVDETTKEKLVGAIKKYRNDSQGHLQAKYARIIAFVPLAVLLVLTTVFIYIILNGEVQIISNHQLIFTLVFYVLFSAGIVFFLIFFIRRYIKDRSYLYPERQGIIWIFRAKCTDVSECHASSRKQHYFAYFQKGGGHIAIRITRYECKHKLPVGKEYIFYKFNNHTGNPWAALPIEKVDEFS